MFQVPATNQSYRDVMRVPRNPGTNWIHIIADTYSLIVFTFILLLFSVGGMS